MYNQFHLIWRQFVSPKNIWPVSKYPPRRAPGSTRLQTNLGLAFLQYLDEKFFFPQRYQHLSDLLSPHLKEGLTVLDVGCSSGRLAHKLAANAGCEIMGVDVCLPSKTWIPICCYDGLSLPFDDNSFECVMMIDMLHHVEDIDCVISEAQRVASRYLLIKDHYWTNRSNYFALCVSDYIGNAPYGVPLPYNYQRLESWGSIFKSQDLEVLTCQTWKYHRFDLSSHVVYKLQVPGAS